MQMKMENSLAGRTTKNRFARFILVGVINTVFGYGCFALFLYGGLHYAVALLLATVLGVLFNFKTTGTLVFGSRNNRLIVRFVLAYACIYAVHVAALRGLAGLGLTTYAAAAVLLLPIAVLAFIINKSFVFRND